MRMDISIIAKSLTRMVFAVVLLMAFIFNPLAMRAHMANAATPAGISMDMPTFVADPSLHEQHQKAPEAAQNICPQMAPCIAVLAAFSGALLDEAPVSIRNTGTGILANSRALAPPYHPPIA